MSGGDIFLSWFTTFLIGVVVVLILVISVAMLPRMARTMTMRFHCPWVHRSVVVQYLTCDGRNPFCVVSCTAFADPRVVTCGMPCVSGDGLGSTAEARRAGDILLGD